MAKSDRSRTIHHEPHENRAALEFANKQDLINLKQDIVKTVEGILQENLKSFSPKKKFLKSTEVRKYLGISRTTLTQLRQNGELPGARINGIYLYDIADVENLINKNK